ncbi:MAG: 30S ribosomal protein S9 [Candidatus Azambacteria bacterium]|nr:30S ribosomal protein S9 [Candidatus Azambacteria bacterium]
MAIKKQKKEKESSKYYEAVGRRKTAMARVRIKFTEGKKEIIVNNKNYTEYFKEKEQWDVLISPFIKTGILAFEASIKTSGGGLRAQAYASRHGLSRALVLANPESKNILKTLGFLTRDSRRKERKKPGLKGARRAPQWSKR